MKQVTWETYGTPLRRYGSGGTRVTNACVRGLLLVVVLAAAFVPAPLLAQGTTDDAHVQPRPALEEARVRLEGGEVAAARDAYMAVVPELRGAEATRVLRLVALLDRVSEAAGTAVGRALGLRDRGEPAVAVDRLVAVADRNAGDAPALLGFAAGLADEAGLDGTARSLRRRLVADYPDAPDAPAALLALGRTLAADGSSAGAREYLERLIIEHPTSPLVPEARQVLEGLDP